MIVVSKLNKIYNTKTSSHQALRDVNLILPNKGLVFVLGKSGSGKSTFLNLIGGLDRATSGSIVVDGNDISGFTETQFVDYRNTCIGFVFQDHHLIDDLTVYQNIKLALDLRRMEDTDLVSRALEQVGLGGYESRFPKELSGGERQRVAIARAIVKQPRIVLADEPTGNLDEKNAADVMRILKELSENCLVLTVSHDTKAVHANASRIIELEDGKIVSDLTRNPDHIEGAAVDNKTLFIPEDHVINEADVEFINKNLPGKRSRRMAISRNKFLPTLVQEADGSFKPIEKTRLTFNEVMSLSFAFLKTKISRIAIIAIPLSLILLVILLSQTYINFDGNRIIADRMKKADQHSVALSKEISLDGVNKNARRYPAPVTKEDIDAFLDTGYEGEIYRILSLSVPVTSYKNSSGTKSTYFSYGVVATESLGTVVVDEEFMTSRLGSLEYVAVERNLSPIGVYITDYLADMILATNSKYKGKDYASLTGEYSHDGSGVGGVFINGIIKTNYKERYSALIDRVTENKETDLAELYNDESFQKLSSELYGFLGYSYTFNPNFEADYIATASQSYLWSHKLVFDGRAEYIPSGGFVRYDAASGLGEGEIIMGYKTYNALFGTSYTADNLESFVPHVTNLSQYAYYDLDNRDAYIDSQVKIAALYNGDGIQVSESVKKLFDKYHIRQTGIYFGSLSHLSDVLEVAEERSFIQDSITLEGILTLRRCVRMFVLIFQLVNIALCAAVVFIFINFSTKMIHDKLHEIGILKAMGTDIITINVIFGLQIGLIALFTCLASVIGYACIVEPANEIFIISLRQMVPSQLVLDLDVLVFIPGIALENVLLVVVLSVISLLVPMAKIARIQPVSIINNRD